MYFNSRHCEHREAIHAMLLTALDCHAALAMTIRGKCYD